MIASPVAGERGRDEDVDGRELHDLAQRLLAPVRALLDHFGAPMLTVARSSTRIRVAPWAPDLTVGNDIGAALAARNGLARELGDARLHGGAVCALLARRWPANGRPPTIGVVSDGVGLAVSGGHPCALTTDWLIDHVAGRSRIDAILPFGARAAMLVQPVASLAIRH